LTRPPTQGGDSSRAGDLQRLRQSGEQTASLAESGAFGPKTQKHVSEFQQKHGISAASGIVGPKTWKALLESWTKLCPLPLDD
jgi:peptidoglycan hydrolase-like protein with peptidoglycan-binding domain